MDVKKIGNEMQNHINNLIYAFEDMKKQRDMWKEKHDKLDEACQVTVKKDIKYIIQPIEQLILEKEIDEDTKKAILDKLLENFKLKSLMDTRGKIANLVLLADNSGSMGIWEKHITRSFAFWFTEILKSIYGKINVKYIVHNTESKIVDEDEFFAKGESGGSISSSGFRNAVSEIELLDYEKEDTYFFYFSDGDNLTSDNAKTIKLFKRIADRVKIAAYIEINKYNRHSSLMSAFKYEKDRFMMSVIKGNQDVYVELKDFTYKLRERMNRR